MSLKNKVVRVVSTIVMATMAVGTVAVGSLMVGRKIEKNKNLRKDVESSYSLILKILNRKHQEKVTGIENVETEVVSETEGVVKVYATAETSRGYEYDCSFSFTGDVKKVESIDEKACELYEERAEQLTKTGEDLEGSKVMQELLAYIDEIADFVEEYDDTCTYKSEAAQKEKITSKTTNEKGEEVVVEYTGSGVFDRSFDYLSTAETLDLYNKVKEIYNDKNYQYKNYISIDLNSLSATVSTELAGTSFFMTLDISEGISSTKTEEMKEQAMKYVLDFLTMSKVEAAQHWKIIKKVDTISVYSKSAWTCINNNVDAKLTYEPANEV